MKLGPVRVRFAPSPTGYLHIGGVRTALFNYLFAKHFGGQFILRIEDTDPERSNALYTEDILKSLQWLGLSWDEGPIFQSQRFERYREVTQRLLEQGNAYFCYCTPQELEAERGAMEAVKKKPMYGGKCRGLKHLKPDPSRPAPVVRFGVDRSGATSFTDAVRGTITFQNSEIEDFVILRADRSPTYNLACVIDDFDGKMTHIIRGDDHINNTPKQVLIFQALKYELPVFVHLPMILGSDKKKLSKRHGAVSANIYRSDGFLPQSVINYLARLGWSHGDQEIFSREELVQFFDLDKVGKSNAVFNTEKLLWLNAHYLREAPEDRLVKSLLEDFTEDLNALGKIPALREKMNSELAFALVRISKQKVKTMKELAALLRPILWEGELPLDSGVVSQWMKSKLSGPFQHILSELDHLMKGESGVLSAHGVEPATLETLFRGTADRFQMKLVELAQPTRFFLTGSTVGPQLFDVMVRMSSSQIRARIQRSENLLR